MPENIQNQLIEECYNLEFSSSMTQDYFLSLGIKLPIDTIVAMYFKLTNKED